MQTPHHFRVSPRGAFAAAFLAAAQLLAAPNPSMAEFGPVACLSQKAQAWGALRQCERREDAKTIAGRPGDRTRCRTRFDRTMEALDARAKESGVACRYRNNGDNTITDFTTGLMWAKLGSRDGVVSAYILDADNRYDWKTALEVPAALNGTAPFPPNAMNPVPGNGGYTDWRLPNFFELATIKDPNAPGCGAMGPLPCADPIFTPTIPGGYWSSTAHNASHVWWVHFGDPTLIGLNAKETFLSVRPVRNAF